MANPNTPEATLLNEHQAAHALGISAGMENPVESLRGRDRLCLVNNTPIVLRAIGRPVPDTRAVLSFDRVVATPVIVGSSHEARDLTCGKCGAVLVSGALSEQFTGEGAIVAENLPKMKVRAGRWNYAERIEIPESGVVIGEGGLVIQCPACQQFNEI